MPPTSTPEPPAQPDSAATTPRIFTFWEPRSNMPAYIRLCLDTWKKHLAGYEVVMLDYANLHEYLPPKDIESILSKSMTLAKQSDCIRAALLARHGGIWLDADTIITSPKFLEITGGADVAMFARQGHIYGAFIYAARPHTAIISRWLEALPARVARHRKINANWLTRCYYKMTQRKEYKQVSSWDYCENAILDPMLHEYSARELCLIDPNRNGILPELTLCPQDTDRRSYEQFWFRPLSCAAPNVLMDEPNRGDTDGRPESTKRSASDQCVDDILQTAAGGIILLHNGWTPAAFRRMSREEFLAQDTAMAALFRALLRPAG